MPDWVSTLPVPVLVAVLLALLVAETAMVIGVVLPGATAAVALGTLVGLGSVPGAAAVLAAVAASALGGQLAYWRGRARAKRTSLAGNRLQRALEARFQPVLGSMLCEQGAWAVVLGQWCVGIRTLMPRLAGHAGMSHRRFSVHQLPTASVWATFMVLTGYGAGAAYQYGWPASLLAGGVVIALLRWQAARAGQAVGHARTRPVEEVGSSRVRLLHRDDEAAVRP